MDSISVKQLLIETKKFLSELPNLNEIILYGPKTYDLSCIDIYMSGYNCRCALLLLTKMPTSYGLRKIKI